MKIGRRQVIIVLPLVICASTFAMFMLQLRPISAPIQDSKGSATLSDTALPAQVQAQVVEPDIPNYNNVSARLKMLYEKYGNDLLRAREYMKKVRDEKQYEKVLSWGGTLGMTYDAECEITYLRIRDWRPDNVIEIGPAFGWSTCWILKALEDNRFGTLYSFDIHDGATKHVPAELTTRWKFVLGNVFYSLKHGHDSQGTPIPKLNEWDYIFIDAEHAHSFARVYCRVFLDRIDNKRPIPVSVHDYYTIDNPNGLDPEGLALFDWLVLSGRGYHAFSAVPGREIQLWEELTTARKGAGINLDDPVSPGDRAYGPRNPMFFFDLRPREADTVPIRRLNDDDNYLDCPHICLSKNWQQSCCDKEVDAENYD